MPDIFDLKKVKVVHLEPTTQCNAACPQCLRTRTPFTPSELDLAGAKRIFNDEFLFQLEKIYMCGNYGDPACAKQTLKIYEYFKSVNPNLTIGMNTNGGIRSPEWWAKLAKIMTGAKDYVVFSIDGLQDTNHMYRVNVRWSKVMQNVKSFIDHGGKAHWDMLIFEHNKHQINSVRTLAKEMGFKWFRAKVSRRFNRFPVDGISIPLDFVDNNLSEGAISCNAMNDNSVYIDAQGRFFPCCWQGEVAHRPNIVQWFNDLSVSWEHNPDPICKKTCSPTKQMTTFVGQWRYEEELN